MLVLSRNFLIFFILLYNASAFAFIQPGEQLADAQLEQKAIVLGYEIRCPSCEGQSINDSQAAMAVALRQHIRAQLVTGVPPEKIKKSLIERYGQEIVFKPSFQKETYFLWAMPFIVLLISAVIFHIITKQNK